MSSVGSWLFRSDAQPTTMPPPGAGDGDWSAVSCSTAAATVLLTSTGALYTVGQNFYGQAGAGQGFGVDELPIAYEPVRVRGMEPSERVLSVAAGFEHVLAVTDAGALYAWGRGDRGQLGLGDKEAYKSAVRVCGAADVFLPAEGGSAEGGAAHRVVAVEAGVSASACVTGDGRLWVWGKMQSHSVKSGTGPGAREAAAAAAAAKAAEEAAAAANPFPTTLPASGIRPAPPSPWAPGPAVAEGVMEDQMLPRPIFFEDEHSVLEAAGEDAGGSPEDGMEAAAAAASGNTALPPLRSVGGVGGDILLDGGLLMGCGALGSGAPPPLPQGPPPPPRRVVAVTSGHAHLSFVTDDGRLWMVGMRGRGRLFDDSAASFAADAADAASRGEGAPTAMARCLSPRSPLFSDVLSASGEAPAAGGGAPGAQPHVRLPLALDLPLPELSVQLRPWELPLGPLAGVRILRLRSSMHHSFALAADGRLFRWGWKGIVLPVRETEGLRLADLQFGFAHAMMLVHEEGEGAQGVEQKPEAAA